MPIEIPFDPKYKALADCFGITPDRLKQLDAVIDDAWPFENTYHAIAYAKRVCETMAEFAYYCYCYGFVDGNFAKPGVLIATAPEKNEQVTFFTPPKGEA